MDVLCPAPEKVLYLLHCKIILGNHAELMSCQRGVPASIHSRPRRGGEISFLPRSACGQMSQVGSLLGSNESDTLQVVLSYQKSNAEATKRACTQRGITAATRKGFAPVSSVLLTVSWIDQFYRRCFWSCKFCPVCVFSFMLE